MPDCASRRAKRRLWGMSFLSALIAIFAAMSPYPHLCPYFARIPWLSSTCPSRDSARASETEDLLDIGKLPVITREELALHNGIVDPVKYPIWMAIDGIVLDVSGAEGQRFYAQGKDYSIFAGTDSTRALALGSLEENDIERGDDVSDFIDWQQQELEKRILFYLEKYPAVAKLGSNSGKLASLLLARPRNGDQPASSGFRL